jgi:hypothetical protein
MKCGDMVFYFEKAGADVDVWALTGNGVRHA